MRVLSKAYEATESLSCHRVIALLRTDRDHEQKLVVTRLFALSPVAVSRKWCFRTFSQYPLNLSSNLFAQHCAVKLPITQQTYDLLCLWRFHRRTRRSLMFGLSLHIFSPKSTLLCCHNLLVVRFPCVFVPQNRARKDFDHEVCLFLENASRMSFSFPNFVSFCTKWLTRISWCVPPKRSIPFLQLSLEYNSLDLSLALFSLRIATAPRLPFFRPPAAFLLTVSMSKQATNAIKSICFQTCNHDTREDVDNHTTIHSRLAHRRQGIFFVCHRTGLQTV